MSKQIKKIIPYLLILIVLVGLFGSAEKVSAQADPNQDRPGNCTVTEAKSGKFVMSSTSTSTNCVYEIMHILKPEAFVSNDEDDYRFNWKPGASNEPQQGAIAPATPTGDKSAFADAVEKQTCSLLSLSWGCFVKLFYWGLYMPATFILWIAATFFNAIISLSLSSNLFTMPFVPSAWGVVRDMSNIFFILILLYIAIKIILGMGGSEVKKMIARVIIVALLINFSMFFTQVVIDSSNILALIFYNKLNVVGPNGKPRPYNGATSPNEKDISGSMYGVFDPTKAISQDFFTQAKVIDIPGYAKGEASTVPEGIMIGITLVAAAFMLFAAYAFFISGVAFVSRLIELLVLIIFSPFAFMSSSVPLLSGAEYIGWEGWSKRLLKVSFMAPIFMFFMYLIFLLIKSDFVDNLITVKDKSMTQTIMLIVIPGMIILILLLKATEFAKKGSGKLGEVLMTGAKLVGGLALGAATGGTALLATGTIGKYAQGVANDDELRKKAAGGDRAAQKRLDRANYFAGKSFDIRQTGLGKFAGSKTGMDFNQGTGILGLSTEKLKGGQKARFERRVEKEEEKRKSYEMTPSAERAQNERTEQYQIDKEIVKANIEKSGGVFTEGSFKKLYEKGGRIGMGLNKDVATGSVEKPDTINAQRRQAYAWSLENPTMKNATDKKDIKDFLKTWKESMIDMTTSKGGIATIATATALGGPIGAALAIPLGGLVQAIKAIIPANKELVGRIAKGKSGDQKIGELLKKYAKGDKESKEAEKELIKEIKKEDTKEEPNK